MGGFDSFANINRLTCSSTGVNLFCKGIDSCLVLRKDEGDSRFFFFESMLFNECPKVEGPDLP